MTKQRKTAVVRRETVENPERQTQRVIRDLENMSPQEFTGLLRSHWTALRKSDGVGRGASSQCYLHLSRMEWPPEVNTEVQKAQNLGLPLVNEPQVIQLAIFMKLR